MSPDTVIELSRVCRRALENALDGENITLFVFDTPSSSKSELSDSSGVSLKRGIGVNCSTVDIVVSSASLVAGDGGGEGGGELILIRELVFFFTKKLTRYNTHHASHTYTRDPACSVSVWLRVFCLCLAERPGP